MITKKETKDKTRITFGHKCKEYIEAIKIRKSLLLAATGILGFACLIVLFIRKSSNATHVAEANKGSKAPDYVKHDHGKAYDRVRNIPMDEILDIFQLRTLSLRDYADSFIKRVLASSRLSKSVDTAKLSSEITHLRLLEFSKNSVSDEEPYEHNEDTVSLRCIDSLGILWPIAFNDTMIKQVSFGGPFIKGFIYRAEIKQQNRNHLQKRRSLVLNVLGKFFDDLFKKSGNSAQEIASKLSGKKYFDITNNELFPALFSLAEEVDRKGILSQTATKIKKAIQVKKKEEALSEISFTERLKITVANIKSLEALHGPIHDTFSTFREAFLSDTEFLNFVVESNKAKIKLQFAASLLCLKLDKDKSIWDRDYVRNLAMLSGTGMVQEIDTESDLSDILSSDTHKDQERALGEIKVILENLIMYKYLERTPVGQGCPLIYPLGRSISHDDILKLLWIDVPKIYIKSDATQVGKYMKEAKGGYVLDREMIKADFLNHEHIKILGTKGDFVRTLDEANEISKILCYSAYAQAANFSKEDFDACVSKAVVMQDKLFPRAGYTPETKK